MGRSEAVKKFILFWMLNVVMARAQQGEVLISTEPELPSRAAEQKQFEYRKKALELQPPGPQRDAQVKQEIQRHLAENKRISMQEQALRKEAISELKQKWTKVEADWKTECARHDARKQQLESLPDGPAKTAQIEAENAAHRNTSKQIAVERNVVHEGVMKQANREVMGGQTGTSNRMGNTKGTAITDPNHRGMNGDLDAGAGYRTTEKAGKILNEIGVKGPNGGPVKITGGVLETAPEFGMTVNAAPGADRIGSAGHQAQVKVGAQHAETYISETGGAVNKGPLKDHLATLDDTKKARHGSNAAPEKLVGGSPEGQVMAKGTLKAANSAGLTPETIEAIAAKNGVKNPGKILDTLAEIKTGRAAITSPEEAAILKKASRDILDAAEVKSKTAAAAEVQAKQTQIAELEAKGLKTQAQQVRNEIADYNAKAKAATEAVRGPVEPVTKPGAASSKPSTTVEPEAKVSGGSKVISRTGLILGIYGIYEGYGKAKEDMEAKKQGDPKGMIGWTKDKAELAGRTLWHGLGFGGMAEIGTQAGKDAFDQYKKDLEAGKISAKDWKPYLEMKGKALAGGLFAAGKAMTYDAAKQSGTNLGNAVGEGLGAAKGLFDQFKSARDEQKTNEARSKEIYDKLIKDGASTMGAQRAADAVKNGDYTEAKRLNKVLEGKKAAKLAAAEPASKTRTYRDRKKREVRKENTTKEIASQEKSTEEELKQREIVADKLRAKGLPTAADLLDRLVAVLQKEGMAGLDAAIAEFTEMQGAFSGVVALYGDDQATLRLQVVGGKVTGTFSQNSTDKDSMTTTTQTMNIPVQGTVDMVSGSIEVTGKGKMTTITKLNPSALKGLSREALKGLQTTTTTVTDSVWLFRGSYYGKGYKGTAAQPWSVSR
jgi:hypothetical protein